MIDIVKIVVGSMLPITELRLSIPYAIGVLNFTWYSALFWSLIGNIIITAFLLFTLEPVYKFLMKNFDIFDRFFTWLFNRTRRKHSKLFDVWGAVALVLFVAIPLPGTGAWSGSLAASVFGIKFKKALPLIIAGLIIAGTVVTILTVGIQSFI
ncbi:ligand-binding protein SH3 [bacterium]|nr:MAG: ligand-binding protein SH3 [bacterium]